MNFALQFPYGRSSKLCPTRTYRNPRVRPLARFQTDQKIAVPVRDEDLGDVIAPELRNCPADIVADVQLRLWLRASETRAIKTSKVDTLSLLRQY